MRAIPGAHPCGARCRASNFAPSEIVVNVQWASGGLRSHERQARDGLAGFLREQGCGAQKFTPPNGCDGFSCTLGSNRV